MQHSCWYILILLLENRKWTYQLMHLFLFQRFNIQSQPMKGCVSSVKTNRHLAFNETVGVSKGCQEDFLVGVANQGRFEPLLKSFSLCPSLATAWSCWTQMFVCVISLHAVFTSAVSTNTTLWQHSQCCVRVCVPVSPLTLPLPLLQGIRKVECKTGGSLEKKLNSFSLTGDVRLSLGFRSTESNGLLLSKTEQVSPKSGHLCLRPSIA